jgi:chromosome partitioning protein
MVQSRQVFVISIASQKGGVGKTTTASSLAGALAKLQKSVLLVDLDVQGNLTISFGIDPQKINHTISDVLFSSATLVSVSRETTIPGVDIVPADNQMENVDRFLLLRQDYMKILSNSLSEPVRKSEWSAAPTLHIRTNRPSIAYYDYLILDCPPSLGAITLNALVASHLLIIPTQPEYFSTYAIHGMMTSVDKVRKLNNPNLCYRLLITMFDKRNRIHRQLSEKLKENFTDLIFNTDIGVDTQLRETNLAGMPISFFNERTRSALQYQALAEEVLQLSNG